MSNVVSSFASNTQSGTIAPATPVVIVIDTTGVRNLALTIANTGLTNPIGSVVVERSPDGTNYGTDTATGTAVGSLAAGAVALVEFVGEQIATQKLRLTLNSASGTTYTVAYRGIT